jgi:chromosome segregation ATPase
MRKVLFFAICLLALASCKEEPKAPVVDIVDTSVADSLQRIIDQRDNEISELMATFNQIEEGFRAINEAEQRVTLAKSGEGSDKVSKIKEDILFIQKRMDSNRKLIDQLRQQLSESSIKGDEFKKTIEMMVSQLEAKDQQLAELRLMLDAKDVRITEMDEAINVLNNDVADLKNESSQKSQTISEQDKQLHVAYYVFGTKSELKEQKILDKDGNVMRGAYNKNYLTKIDTRNQKVIKLYSKYAKLLTDHPTSSYKLEMDASKQYTLHITNEDQFWHTSKVLVIMVK